MLLFIIDFPEFSIFVSFCSSQKSMWSEEREGEKVDSFFLCCIGRWRGRLRFCLKIDYRREEFNGFHIFALWKRCRFCVNQSVPPFSSRYLFMCFCLNFLALATFFFVGFCTGFRSTNSGQLIRLMHRGMHISQVLFLLLQFWSIRFYHYHFMNFDFLIFK